MLLFRKHVSSEQLTEPKKLLLFFSSSSLLLLCFAKTAMMAGRTNEIHNASTSLRRRQERVVIAFDRERERWRTDPNAEDCTSLPTSDQAPFPSSPDPTLSSLSRRNNVVPTVVGLMRSCPSTSAVATRKHESLHSDKRLHTQTLVGVVLRPTKSCLELWLTQRRRFAVDLRSAVRTTECAERRRRRRRKMGKEKIEKTEEHGEMVPPPKLRATFLFLLFIC